MKILDIQTPTQMSHEFTLSGNRTTRLIESSTEPSATSYLSGPAAQAYINLELFQQHNITLEFEGYAMTIPILKLRGEFTGEVTVLDSAF